MTRDIAPNEEPFKSILKKMRTEGLSEAVQTSLLYAAQTVLSGADGTIPEKSIAPVTDIANGEKLQEFTEYGIQALPQTAIIKLNGGLGTSMGMAQAKSLLPVKNGLSFLDIIAQQTMQLRAAHKIDVPLIFMNSFRTEADTLASLKSITGIDRGQGSIDFSFLQNKVPKLRADDLRPVEYPSDPEQEWCPPGHGDIYVALRQSGILRSLIDAGYRYAFISNADNLGATLDVGILGYLVSKHVQFLMEVADRTVADNKGGHLARYASDDRLLLREIAQTADDDLAAFQDIKRHRYFNTNSIWIDLTALSETLDANKGYVPLPVIVNKKHVNPTDSTSLPILQLESAMGAAIEIFERAQALRIARSRFLPIKKTSDLLILMSDIFDLSNHGVLQKVSDDSLPVVALDAEHYQHIDNFLARFPNGAPSLVDCTELTVTGDVYFGQAVRCVGKVHISAPAGESRHIPDGTLLEG